MQRLIIVSNRLPVSIEKRRNKLSFKSSVGGLATGLGSFYESYNSVWVGWPGTVADKISVKEKKIIKDKLTNNFSCYPIFLSKREVDFYYNGFCNKTIWPLFHYFTQYIVYNEKWWNTYKEVNEKFSEAVIKNIKGENDLIWVHDYHLMLLPKLIREKVPSAKIGFFLHTPFPSSEIFRILPWRKEIIKGLIGSDLIGFHTYDYVRHFLSSVHYILGYDHNLGQIKLSDRIVKADIFPMGIDYKRFSESIEDEKIKREIKNFKKKLGDNKIVLSIDRLDYTKGIEERLKAFSTFLEKNPQYKKKITLILVAVPSRTKVERYEKLKKHVDELVGRINGKYAYVGWSPVFYLYRSLPFRKLVALYHISDVALITPLRDGMNLIAKEYVATKKDGNGVLVLSEMAGAAKELGEAIIISPHNEKKMVEALESALIMPEDEKRIRNRIMQDRLKQYDVTKWAKEFIDRLNGTKKIQDALHGKKLNYDTKNKLIRNYKAGRKRLLIFDYDGTLVPFFKRPEKAEPTKELLSLLKRLSNDRKNTVVIVSGRDKITLNKWFSHLPVGLIAEHGVWIKRDKDSEWNLLIENLSNSWKKDILPIFELFIDRTPGSFIEDKNFSLVFHYRKVSPGLGRARSRELIDTLENFITNLNLHVLEGDKVIEVKNSGINKGKAVLKWLKNENYDFILSIGDDRTDEDVFEILPKNSYSIKVGLFPSFASYNIDSQKGVISLLRELIIN